MNGYRKELKFIVEDAVLVDIRNRISGLMRRDEHQTGDFYRIRSLYLDSPRYTCLEENLAGVSPREKYRIRTYNCDNDVISAEIKIRHRDTISKMNTRISRELFDMIVGNNSAKAIAALTKAAEDRVLARYLARIATEGYKSACIVDYERSAFIYDIANVRITFDRNVFASTEFARFFDPDLTGRPALDGSYHILEIKYDEFLPDEIKEALGGAQLTRSNSSKYAQCMMRYNSYGGRT